MMPTQQGAFRLFRAAGVTVFLHWTWLLVAVFQIQRRGGTYSTPIWDGLEYLTLFGIVLLHEFGHALACRSVGGRAEQIVLWPLGGVAYVQPPQRPGATLWSIAAGPLVNVVLFVLLSGVAVVLGATGWSRGMPDAHKFLVMTWMINLILLIFNLLPIYPLDGGQILRSVLWFFLGHARSLLVATFIGFAGVVLLVVLAFRWENIWLGIVAAFVLMNCWQGWQQARALLRLARIPRHRAFACPSCRTAPPAGNLWVCDGCGHEFDIFAANGGCPQCRQRFAGTRCVDCGATFPLAAWAVPPVTRP